MRDRIPLVVLLLVVIVLAVTAYYTWDYRHRATRLWNASDHHIATIVLYGAENAAKCSAGVNPYRIKAKAGHIVVWDILDGCKKKPTGAEGTRKVTLRFRLGDLDVTNTLLETLDTTDRLIAARVRNTGQTVYQYDVSVDGMPVVSAEFESCPDWPCGKIPKREYSATAAR